MEPIRTSNDSPFPNLHSAARDAVAAGASSEAGAVAATRSDASTEEARGSIAEAGAAPAATLEAAAPRVDPQSVAATKLGLFFAGARGSDSRSVALHALKHGFDAVSAEGLRDLVQQSAGQPLVDAFAERTGLSVGQARRVLAEAMGKVAQHHRLLQRPPSHVREQLIRTNLEANYEPADARYEDFAEITRNGPFIAKAARVVAWMATLGVGTGSPLVDYGLGVAASGAESWVEAHVEKSEAREAMDATRTAEADRAAAEFVDRVLAPATAAVGVYRSSR
ncbi:MAG: hypothetical protein D6729_18450 [Deltaproteobacteria bacterium]|nr:MAG: hypothetical protein D6729_18450 [Deltaproteobacteria bacterium]